MDRYLIQREYAKAYRVGDENAMQRCREKLIAIQEYELTKYKLEKYKVA